MSTKEPAITAAESRAERPTDPAVLFERRGPIGLLTLNRPDNRNGMTAELLEAFAVAVDRARSACDMTSGGGSSSDGASTAADGPMRALVITGRGPCFSAGADLRAQVQASEAALPHERSFAMYRPFLSLLDLEVPTIAAMSGHAVGGGFGLALLCDLRVAAHEARYGANFVRIGLSPGMAISALLPRLVGAQRAAELLLTGRLCDGAEAARIGLALEALPAAQVLDRAMELADTIARAAPLAVRETRRLLRAESDAAAIAMARLEARAQSAILDSTDAAEGIAALLEKRAPRFGGR